MERQYFHGEVATLMLYGRAIGEEERLAIDTVPRVEDEDRTASEQRASRAIGQRKRQRMTSPQLVKSWPALEAYLREQPAPRDVYSLPVRTDLREAISLSMTHLNSLFDGDRDDEPYFLSTAWRMGRGRCSIRSTSASRTSSAVAFWAR
jgi:hypothetical protein